MKLELDYLGIINALTCIKKKYTWKKLSSELGLSEYQTKKLIQKKDINLLPDSAILLIAKHSYNIKDFLLSNLKNSNHYTAMLALELDKIKYFHSNEHKFDNAFLHDIKLYICSGKKYLSDFNSDRRWERAYHILNMGKTLVHGKHHLGL